MYASTLSPSLVTYLFGVLNRTVVLPPPDPYYETNSIRQEYDFVIVGAGSAGCVVANRLSANPNVTVLVIEAGHAESIAAEVPLVSIAQIVLPPAWVSKVVPQENACLSYHRNSCLVVRGKVLGGTSVINAMQFVRGNRRDYDRWAANGLEGWSYEDVLPYFKDIERFDTPRFADSAYRGTDGEQPCNFAPGETPLARAILKGWNELGYPTVDFNGRTQRGCSKTQFILESSRRVSSSKAFIRPVVRERKNLHITLGSMATKIEFDGLRAVGVHYKKSLLRVPHYVRAKREVILCAGAIGSPQLLMLSGIGPKSELQRLGINVIADLPVGRNLQDHPIVGGVAVTMEKDAGINPFDPTLATEYVLDGTGPVNVAAGVETLAFVNSALTRDDPDYPDVQVIQVSISLALPGGELAAAVLNLKQKVYKEYYTPNRDKYGFLLVPVFLRPQSRGVVTLSSTDPYAYPDVNPRYLTNPADVRSVVEATKEVLRVLDTEALRALGAKRWDIHAPGCEDKELWSDEYIACLASQMTETTWHYSCTCPMGNDDKAVVDSRLRVRGGVQRLRVIDCSVMPNITSGNPSVPAQMIGAKGAAMILEDHGLEDPNSV